MSANLRGRVGVWTTGLARNPHLRALLGADELVFRPERREPVDFVVGWGRKPNTDAPRRFAREHAVPFLALEDGFVRSLSPGVSGDPPLSIVVDDVGIYYDSTGPSAIEQRLAAVDRLDDALLARARRAIDTLRRERISKYNDGPARRLPPSERRRVLVVDQTAGDLSIALGGAGERPFDRMLEAALDENPDAEIVIKTHPDVALGKRRANFASIPRDRRISMFSEPASPIELLEDVDRVYVVTSLLGLEALLSDKRVTCFGMPFYAGWGLTDDRASVPERRGRDRSLEHLFAEAYLSYARYVDPETGQRCELEQVIDHLALQRRTAGGGGRHYVCVGFSAWKRAFVPSFLGGPLSRVEFASDARAAARKLEEKSSIVVWGTREDDEVRALAARSGAPLCRMEDGFLRSVGLGSDLNAPASLVVDADGIYYDPRTPSGLETVLEARAFTDEELARARALRERIVAVGISKYNLGTHREIATARGERDVVLVVGQVEDDASIRLGCVDVRTNEALLHEARRARPDAYVIWKPHPDVVRGNRAGAVDPARAREWADEIVEDVPLADCLAVALEVHTMTSLVGFEALLRGRRVVVYGQPFYAGWGLTEDRHPHPRRTARLTLDELVAGTLLRYPRYVSATTRRFSTPERIVDELLEARDHARASGTSSSWPRRELGKAQNLARTLLGGRSSAKTEAPSAIATLGCTSALLLQGPAGPFMHRLGRELRDAGIRTTKINFHAGDVLFYPRPDALAFRAPLDELAAFVRRVIEEREVDAIFLFGDCRAHHRIAIEVARELGITVWAFEEGYLRPDWITIERGGVNGHSSLPRDPQVYLRAALPKPPAARKLGNTFGTMSWYSTLNALTFTHLNQGFPHYRHHRNLNAWFHTYSWVRGAARKKLYLRREADILPRLQGELSGRFFLAALQVHCDFQLVHSKYDDVVDFIHDVVRTFAEHGDPRDSLVIKHHPMDRPFREYGPLMRDLAREHGLGDRLIYVHDLHLPTLLEHARGTITINSTTALQSLHHGTPVKAMGDAIYVLPGLTFQGELAEFLRDPGTFDRELYRAFRHWLLVHNQANGSFYVRPPGTESATGIRWPAKPDAPARRAPSAAAEVAARRAPPKRGSKLSKLRNSPERFFADSKSGVLRAIGRVVAPPLAKSELAMAVLENPLEALREHELPLLSAGARQLADRRARARRALLDRAGRPLVSIVVAGRNAEDCIERSIRSLLAQTHRELEILVVDDASTDRTAEIVRGIAASDDRVQLFRNDRRRRAAMSRNVGLAQAKGAYVTFQDADDTSHPERIERQLAALLERPDAVLCVCNHRRETADGERVVVNGRRFARNFISMMFPREKVLARLGYLRELEVGEDAEYYERIRAVFGPDRELHLFETLYRARFAETSLLFSNGEVRKGSAFDVTYVQSPSAKRALDDAMMQVESIRREGTSPFVPFSAELSTTDDDTPGHHRF